MMSGRIKSVRQLLHDELAKLNPDKDWSFVLQQIGMFSYTGARFICVFDVHSQRCCQHFQCAVRVPQHALSASQTRQSHV